MSNADTVELSWPLQDPVPETESKRYYSMDSRRSSMYPPELSFYDKPRFAVPPAPPKHKRFTFEREQFQDFQPQFFLDAGVGENSVYDGQDDYHHHDDGRGSPETFLASPTDSNTSEDRGKEIEQTERTANSPFGHAWGRPPGDHKYHWHHHDFSVRPMTAISKDGESVGSTVGARRNWSQPSSAPFSPQTLPTEYCSEASCSGGDLDPPIMDSDTLASVEEFELAGEVDIFDENGNARKFKSLYEGTAAIGEQQLIIFMRHFFCGACQAYLKELNQAISLGTYFTLPVPTSITIIGLGGPELISSYRKFTNTPFPIYTDPTRRLHRLLGMSWSISWGPRTSYWNVNRVTWVTGQMKQMMTVDDQRLLIKGGGFWWNGGEFLVKEGKLVWCHRMRNYRDHAEMPVLKRLLGVEER